MTETSKTPSKSGWFGLAVKTFLGGTLLAGVGTTVYVANDEGLTRSAKCIYYFTPVAIAYMMCDWRMKGRDEAAVVKAREELHQKYAPVCLDILLNLGGYYIKMGQTLVGANLLPKLYEEVFTVLLDQCPSQPFSVVRKIIEMELGCPVEEVFASVDEKPIGAASIGQVHRATLHDGTEVVVKVQYPDVERFFRLDFETTKFLCSVTSDYGEMLDDVLDGMAATFDSEFDYSIEARNLRTCASNLDAESRKHVFIPLPLDEAHPSSPAGYRLCTKRLLTMELVHGRPVRSVTRELMEEWAKSQGLTLEVLQAQLEEDMKDPAKLDEYLTQSPPSEFLTSLTIGLVWVSHLAHNACAFALNHSWGWLTNRTWEYSKVILPLNGARIIRILFQVHAKQIFTDGIFNSDPHSGNVIVMDDGRLGLVDYGGVCVLPLKERLAFARLLIAIDDGDDDAAVQHFQELGARSKDSNKAFHLIAALACFHRGMHPDDMERAGVPKDMPLIQLDAYLNTLDKWEKFDGGVVMLQRCAAVLLGLAGETGAGGVSIAHMWRDAAEKCLKQAGTT